MGSLLFSEIPTEFRGLLTRRVFSGQLWEAFSRWSERMERDDIAEIISDVIF